MCLSQRKDEVRECKPGQVVHVVGPPVTRKMNRERRENIIVDIVKLAVSIRGYFQERPFDPRDFVTEDVLMQGTITIPVNIQIVGEKEVDARDDKSLGLTNNQSRKRFWMYAGVD